MRHRRYLHWRGCRGGSDRCQIRQRRRGVIAHGHPLLVLRLGNDGHGPADPESCVGIQRHRATGRGLSGGCAGGAQPERAARFWHLRARCAGCGRHDDPGRCAGEDTAFRPGWLERCLAAGKVVRLAGRGLDGDRRLDCRPAFLRELPGDAGRVDRHERVHSPHRRRHLRSGWNSNAPLPG